MTLPRHRPLGTGSREAVEEEVHLREGGGTTTEEDSKEDMAGGGEAAAATETDMVTAEMVMGEDTVV